MLCSSKFLFFLLLVVSSAFLLPEAVYADEIDTEQYEDLKKLMREAAEEESHYLDDKRIERNIFFIISAVVMLWFFYHRYKLLKVQAQWKKGVFPKSIDYTTDNLMEAYLRLAAMMMRYDKEATKEKIGYTHRYFQKHFPDSKINFTAILREAYAHPLKLETVAFWLNKHANAKHERIQVLYFLAGLSVVDGELNHSEKSIITKLCDLLQLSKKDLDSVLSMYEKYEYRERKTYQRSSTTKGAKNRAIETCSKILGVSTEAGITEIKKAYRSLVKVHHPDRFVNSPKEQQLLANERFLKIQKAYEFLEEVKF